MVRVLMGLTLLHPEVMWNVCSRTDVRFYGRVLTTLPVPVSSLPLWVSLLRTLVNVVGSLLVRSVVTAGLLPTLICHVLGVLGFSWWLGLP